MIRSAHPVAEEELMAYLDGELPLARARECATHLAQCSECQALASDLKAVYQQMTAWQVGPAPESVGAVVRTALDSDSETTSVKRPVRFNSIRTVVKRRWVWVLAGAAAFVLANLTVFSVWDWMRARWVHPVVTEPVSIELAQPSPQGDVASNSSTSQSSGKPEVATNLRQLKLQADEATRQYEELEKRYVEQNMASSLAKDSTAPAAVTASGDQVQETGTFQATMPSAPMIARTASVNLVAKDFDKARTELDTIVRRHNGYAADLKLDAPPDQGRALTASLRVPADQLDVTLAELKKLGRVEQESQGGEEVSEQYVDLNARLSNDRNTEQRLLQILNQRAGKLSDVLAVEQEVARVRGEIEQMEAERKSLEHRVAYTSVDVQVKEEYKAALQVTPPSTFSQMRNSLVEGVESAVDSLVGLVRFLLYAGPTLLLWALILFFPARLVWRRWRASTSSAKGSA